MQVSLGDVFGKECAVFFVCLQDFCLRVLQEITYLSVVRFHAWLFCVVHFVFALTHQTCRRLEALTLLVLHRLHKGPEAI